MRPMTQADPTASDHLRAALRYARRGWAVFPCGPDKRPLVRTGFKAATRNHDQIKAWWTQWPTALIGCPTGRRNGLVILDVDVDPTKGVDGDSALGDLVAVHGALPASLETLTPRGGRHCLFAHPGADWNVPCSASQIGRGLDIRGDGGYVILAPSRLPDGRSYQWEGSSDPDEGATLAPMPNWLLALVAVPSDRPTTTVPAAPQVRPAGDGPTIPEGGRNDFLFRVGRSLRAKGLSEAAIIGALLAENAARCNPPLPDSEVLATARSCASKAPGLSAEYAGLRRVAAVHVPRGEGWGGAGEGGVCKTL